MIPETIAAWLLESERAEVRPVLAALSARHGPEWVQVQMRLTSQNDPSPNPFARGTVSAADLPPAEEPQRLWFGLYPRSVALLIGETGAVKSSFLYNLCLHAARNEPLWDVGFGLGRPLRVLYVDPENSGNYQEGKGGQCAVKIERIGRDAADAALEALQREKVLVSRRKRGPSLEFLLASALPSQPDGTFLIS